MAAVPMMLHTNRPGTRFDKYILPPLVTAGGERVLRESVIQVNIRTGVVASDERAFHAFLERAVPYIKHRYLGLDNSEGVGLSCPEAKYGYVTVVPSSEATVIKVNNIGDEEGEMQEEDDDVMAGEKLAGTDIPLRANHRVVVPPNKYGMGEDNIASVLEGLEIKVGAYREHGKHKEIAIKVLYHILHRSRVHVARAKMQRDMRQDQELIHDILKGTPGTTDITGSLGSNGQGGQTTRRARRPSVWTRLLPQTAYDKLRDAYSLKQAGVVSGFTDLKGAIYEHRMGLVDEDLWEKHRHTDDELTEEAWRAKRQKRYEPHRVSQMAAWRSLKQARMQQGSSRPIPYPPLSVARLLK